MPLADRSRPLTRMVRLPRSTAPLGPPRASARQAVLAAWHGVDLAPLELAQADGARPLRELMPRVLDRLGLERRALEAQVIKAWPQLVDPKVAAHASPTGLRRGTLFVSVDSHTWCSEIVRWHRREILARLQLTFGQSLVAKVSFRVG